MALMNWVRAARKAKGWTQQQLGDELGLTKANISGWENGRHLPSFAQILKISELTGHAIPGDPASGLVFAEEPELYMHPKLSPVEADVLAALRRLPEEEQLEFAHDLMARAERIDQLVERALKQRGIEVSGYVSATRAAEQLPPAPGPAPGSAQPQLPPGDYGHLGTPSHWHLRQHAAAKVDKLGSHGMEEVEIPAFLRKGATPPSLVAGSDKDYLHEADDEHPPEQPRHRER